MLGAAVRLRENPLNCSGLPRRHASQRIKSIRCIESGRSGQFDGALAMPQWTPRLMMRMVMLLG
jgi:hypothetical protein